MVKFYRWNFTTRRNNEIYKSECLNSTIKWCRFDKSIDRKIRYVEKIDHCVRELPQAMKGINYLRLNIKSICDILLAV